MLSELNESAIVTFKPPRAPKLKPTAVPNLTAIPRILLPPSLVQKGTEIMLVEMCRKEILSKRKVVDYER